MYGTGLSNSMTSLNDASETVEDSIFVLRIDPYLCSIGSCQILYCKEYDARLIVNSDEQQHKFNLRGENKSGARGQRDVVAVDGIEYSLAVLYQL